jgi:predicted ATPase
MERARANQPEFVLNEATSPAVTLICQRLDGIPLAIELAAARVAVLNVQQIADRLEDMFRLLAGGSRTTVPRHQTLRAAIHWSYDLLEPIERILFRRLAVFVGGFTLEAVEGVCAGSAPAEPARADSAPAGPANAGSATADPASTLRGEESLQQVDILDILLRLVNKSLVVVDYHAERPTRYHMLETIRQFAREMLLESGEVESLQQRHREWYVAWVNAGFPKQMSAEIRAWLDLVEDDLDNLRAALEWSYQEGTGRRLPCSSAAPFRYWWMRSLAEGAQWIHKVGAKADRPDLTQPCQGTLYRLLGHLRF